MLSICSDLIQRYENFRQSVSKGEFKKTAQFWLNYLDQMRASTPSTPSSRCNTSEWLRDAFSSLGKSSSLLLYIQQNELCPIWILLRSAFETNRKQVSWIIALWIMYSRSRDRPSVNCNRPTGWANYKKGYKNFSYANGVLITQFSWRKELFYFCRFQMAILVHIIFLFLCYERTGWPKSYFSSRKLQRDWI